MAEKKTQIVTVYCDKDEELVKEITKMYEAGGFERFRREFKTVTKGNISIALTIMKFKRRI